MRENDIVTQSHSLPITSGSAWLWKATEIQKGPYQARSVILPVQYLQLELEEGRAHRQDNCVAALSLNTLSAPSDEGDPVLEDLLCTL